VASLLGLRVMQLIFRSAWKKTVTHAQFVGVSAAYVVSTSCYFYVAITGYASYGKLVAEDVLLSQPRSSKVGVGVANMMVWLHVLAAYQVFSQPIFEALEKGLAKVFERRPRQDAWLSSHGWVSRAIVRVTYVMIITLVAATLPFFTDLMGLIGAVGFIPMTFVVPAILYLVKYRGTLSLPVQLVNWVIIVSFSAIGFVSFVAACANIRIRSKGYDAWA
jgi:amino acid permease